jgi:hypothetical protein
LAENVCVVVENGISPVRVSSRIASTVETTSILDGGQSLAVGDQQGVDADVRCGMRLFQ